MNKRLLSAITIIVAFLAVAFIVTSKPNTQEKINLRANCWHLQLVTHPALDQIHHGIVAGLKSQGTQVKRLD